MSVTATNLILGPATLYSAPFGSTEPANTNTALTAPPIAPWVDLGGTSGGLTLTINQTYTPLTVDQLVDNVGGRLTAREITLATSLAEATLQNLAVALNGGTIAAGTPGTVPATYTPKTDSSATQPTSVALLFDGWAPGVPPSIRRVIVRKVLQTGSIGVGYQKDGQTLFPVTFTAYYVSASIAPFFVQDQV
jgi:hypothetical protein